MSVMLHTVGGLHTASGRHTHQ